MTTHDVTSMWLARLEQLPDNWDHEGAYAVRPECLALAHTLAATLAVCAIPPPYVAPTYDGGVLFMWDNEFVDYELMMETDHDVRFCFIDRQTGEENGGTIHVSDTVALRELGEEIALRSQPLGARFATLTTAWREATIFSSSIQAIVEHPAYRRIVAMGRSVLPLILQALEAEPDHWFAALHEITGEDPVPEQDEPSFETRRQAWLAWGRRHHLLPDGPTSGAKPPAATTFTYHTGCTLSANPGGPRYSYPPLNPPRGRTRRRARRDGRRR